MEYIGKFISNFKEYYNGINAATLTGAIDVIIVQQEDGSFISSPFHVRFGKLGVLRSREKVVDIEINGDPVDIHMKLGESGEAFFVYETDPESGVVIPPYLATSPLPPHLLHQLQLQEEPQPLTPEQQQQPVAADDAEADGDETDGDDQCHRGDAVVVQMDAEAADGGGGGGGGGGEELHAEAAEDEAMEELEVLAATPPSLSSTPPPQQQLHQLQQQQQDAVEMAPLDMNEEERKRWNKRRRKRRSQIRRKQLQEAAKNSSESSDVYADKEDEDEPPTPTPADSAAPPALPPPLTEALMTSTPLDGADAGADRAKGHRKSRSVSTIQLAASPVADRKLSDSSSRVDSWIHGNAIISRSLGPEFHFFSDTELEGYSPGGSRPATPIHSDTEYEVGLQRANNASANDSDKGTQQSWRWGELPSPPVHKSMSRSTTRDATPADAVAAATAAPQSDAGSDPTQTSSDQVCGGGVVGGSAGAAVAAGGGGATTPEEEAQRSMLGHMFSFLRQKRGKGRQGSAKGGGDIYLDDFNDLDPELAALYLPPPAPSSSSSASSFRRGLPVSAPTNIGPRVGVDEDAESGKGASLPQSPQSLSAEMAAAMAMRLRSGPRSVDSDFDDRIERPDMALSLCGILDECGEPPEDLFLQSLVTYDDFIENPQLVDNPDLVVRIGSKFYTWPAACQIVMSYALYQRPLPASKLRSLPPLKAEPKQSPQKKEEPQQQQQQQPQQQQQKQEPQLEEKQEPQQQQQQQQDEVKKEPVRASYSWLPWRRSKLSIGEPASLPAEASSSAVAAAAAASVSSSSAPQPPLASLPAGDLLNTSTTGTSSDNDNDSDSTLPTGAKKRPIDQRSYYDHLDHYCKTLRLTTEQIEKLHLREGPNEAVFSVTTAYQGTTRCKCHIYLWRHDDKVVISDIDGTITKSDVLGHILPIVGQDWAQSGVAQLFTKIKNNGYRILYLSARAIGQARITREYLRSVRQNDLSLPDGPLLLNPTSLLSAFHREVIEKKPEEFKISCLRDIQALFPTCTNPFYAGYGNRVNDVWAYRAVGIPTSRIFTINPRGELKLELTQAFQSSYSKQSFIVDLVFPPLHGAGHEDVEGSEYNEFMFWKEPVLELDPEEAAMISGDYSGLHSYPPALPASSSSTTDVERR